MTRIVPANEARDLLQPIPDTEVEPYTEASFFHEADGEVEFHGVRYTDKRTVDGIAYPVSGCATRAWADLAAAAPDLARTVIQQAEQIKRLQRSLSLNVIRGGPNPLTRFEYMYERGELLPDDMETADE